MAENEGMKEERQEMRSERDALHEEREALRDEREALRQREGELNIAGIYEILKMFRESNQEAHNTIIATNDSAHKTIIELLEKQNGRIKQNEEWRIRITGIAIGVALASGAVGSAIFKFLF